MEHREANQIINWVCTIRIRTIEDEIQTHKPTTLEIDNKRNVELKRLRALRHTAADW